MTAAEINKLIWKIAYWAIGISICVFIVHVITTINRNSLPVSTDTVEEKYSCLNSKNLISNGENRFIVITPKGEKINCVWRQSDFPYDLYLNKNSELYIEDDKYRPREFSCNFESNIKYDYSRTEEKAVERAE